VHFAVVEEGTMSDEPLLRQKAGAAVQNGKIPGRRPDRTWGGPGIGAVCAVCELPIERHEMEFDVQFARDGRDPGLDKYYLHSRCFAAWEFERTEASAGGSRAAVGSGSRMPAG
jgi:hypothetical protein